jgi:cytochrome c-type biogenesis protein CcmH
MTSPTSPSRLRTVLRPIITAVLAAVVLWGIGVGLTGQHDTDAVRAITTRLRCPVCQGESVADSPSQNAQEITTLVQQQLQSGWSTEQIEQYFIDRYGDWVLLDPPRSGATLWLWVAPVVALTVGAMAIVSRLGPSPRRRVLVGVAGGLGVATVALLVVLGAAERGRRVGDAAPPPTSAGQTAAGRPLAEVSNDEMEAVIAQNPTVIGMRLALVERYLRDGDVDDAYRHTTVAIDLPATDQEYEHALRLHGWVTALRGAPASGAEYLRAALTLSPDDRDAIWFLANVEWHGLGDADAATELLDRLLAGEVSDDQRTQIEALVTDIESGIGAGDAP